MSRAEDLKEIVSTLMRVMLVSERTSPQYQHVVRYNPLDFHTLGMLRAQPGLRASMLAQGLGVAPTTASSVIARMVKRGHIKRTKSPDDGRAIALSLTDEGLALANTIYAQDIRNMELFLSAVSEDEQDQMLALLDKVRRRVLSLEGTAESG